MKSTAPESSIADGSGAPVPPPASRNAPVLVCVLLALFLAAMDSTVVVTLLPSVIDEMHIEVWYPWLFSGFILAGAIITPLVGRVADVVGPKRTMLGALVVFLITSAVVAVAPNGGVLTVARILQGAGAGALTVMAYVLAGSMYSEERRARLQSTLTAVWGVSAVGGPVLGTLFVETVGWRWVFAMNIPLALITIAVIALGYRDEPRQEERGDKLVDWPAMALFSLVLSALLVLLLAPNLPLGSGVLVAVAVGLAALLVAQAVYLRRHPGRSVVPLAIARPGRIRNAALLTLGASLALHGSLTILPLAADKLGIGAVAGAVTVMAGAAGLIAGSTFCAPLMKARGYRGTGIVGSGLMVLGSGLLVAGALGLVPLVLLTLGEGLVGVATGLLLGMPMVFIQDVAPAEDLGVYTSAVSLLRNVGGALGVNLLASTQLFASANLGGGSALAWSFGIAFAVQLVVVALGGLAGLRLPNRLEPAKAETA